MTVHLAELFARTADRHGARLALLDGDERISFAELVDRASALGWTLLDHGLRRGDRVALLLPTDHRYAIIEYGVLVSGLVRVPLDPSLRPDDWRTQLEDCGAGALVYDGVTPEALAELRAALPEVRLLPAYDGPDALLAQSLVAPRRAHAAGPPGDLAALMYSGGTTSRPKAAVHSHATLATVVRNILSTRTIGPDERFLNVRPLWPAASVTVLAQLLGGGTVVLAGRFSPERFCAAAHEHRATVSSLVPTMLHRLVDHLATGATLPDSLQRIDIGAAGIHPDTFQRFLDLAGPRLGVLYGLCEAPWSCYQPPEALRTGDPIVRARRIATSGRPLPNVELRIVDEAGAGRARGETGEIELRGPHLMLGYWGADPLPAGEGVRTGDLGHLDADGFVRITGRLRELIRTGGVSVSPAPVEQALLEHPDVVEAAVVGVPDAEWGERVAAVVVLRPGASEAPDALAAWCRDRVAAYARPRLVHVVDALPRSHYGKVLKAQLRDELVELAAAGDR